MDSIFFSFNNLFYKQIFGTPMSSPLSPMVADLVIQDLEEMVISKLSPSFLSILDMLTIFYLPHHSICLTRSLIVF